MTTPLYHAAKRLEAIALALASPGLCEPEQALELVQDARNLVEVWQKALERLPAELQSEIQRRADVPSIVCPKCGRRSYNANDIAARYCGACHEFHSP